MPMAVAIGCAPLCLSVSDVPEHNAVTCSTMSATRRMILLSSILLYICGVVSVCGEYSAASISTHIDSLLAEYDREVLPTERVLVTLSLDVRYADLCDTTATMRMFADLKMNWSDPRLTWNSSTFEERSVLVPADRLWRPDIEAVGAAAVHGGTGGMRPQRARLSNDGEVSAVTRLDLSVPVALQLERWPEDEQEAVFKFASREYSQDELDLDISHFQKTAVVVETGMWQVKRVRGEVRSRDGEGEPGVRVVQWAVRVSRLAELQRVITSAVMLSAQGLLVAALARPHRHRAPFAIAAAVISAAWLLTVSFHLPGSSTRARVVVAGGWWCGVATCTAVGAVVVARTAARTAPPSAALRSLLSKVSTLYVLAPQMESSSEGECTAWAAAARLLDAALVALLLVALLAITIYYYC